VEDSESAKQEPKKWQPGSAQAQFGVNYHLLVKTPELTRNISLS
jgi:hypothetical protein